MTNQLIAAYNNKIASIYESNPGKEVKIWMRALHRTGAIHAYQVGEKDAPIHCFAVFTDGTIKCDRHENLVGLFKDG